MTKLKMNVTKDDLDLMLFASFRYAIGRKTYIVGTVVDLIIKFKDQIYVETADRIVHEIQEAHHRGLLGEALDVHDWFSVVEALTNEKC